MSIPAIGTRGMTSNMQMGKVVSSADDQGWFRVRLDDGGSEILNAERFSTTHVFGDPTRSLSTVEETCYGCGGSGMVRTAPDDADTCMGCDGIGAHPL